MMKILTTTRMMKKPTTMTNSSTLMATEDCTSLSSYLYKSGQLQPPVHLLFKAQFSTTYSNTWRIGSGKLTRPLSICLELYEISRPDDCTCFTKCLPHPCQSNVSDRTFAAQRAARDKASTIGKIASRYVAWGHLNADADAAWDQVASCDDIFRQGCLQQAVNARESKAVVSCSLEQRRRA